MSDLKRFGQNTAANLSNFAGVAAMSGLNILDFGGKADSLLNDDNTLMDRALIFDIENLGKPVYDENNALTGYTPAKGAFKLFQGFSILNNLEYDKSDIFEDLLKNNSIVLKGYSGSDEIDVKVSSEDLFRTYLFLMLNPAKVGLTTINFNKEEQKQEKVNLTPFTPFARSSKSRTLRYNDFRSPNQFDQLVVQINENYVLDSNIDLEIGLAADVKLGVTFYCGASANTGKALAKAVDAAQKVKVRRKGLGGRYMKR